MLEALRWAVVVLGALAVTGTLIGFSKSPHWFVRLWDFPRVQIAVLAVASGLAYATLFFRGSPLEWAGMAVLGFSIARQGREILPYTRLSRVQVQCSSVGRTSSVPDPRRATFRLLVSNVLMENHQHDRLLGVVREADPDLILALETDAVWAKALEPLARTHPHVVRQPQENYYGMMLFSRLPLIDPRVEFWVQDDIPSLHTAFELPSGDHVFLHCLHPRPPEPIRDQDSTPRDAELVLVGKAVRAAADRPTVVAGDLNDVAWSPTSELFIRLSGLLDPRVGRGFFNSFNANNPLLRYPLDHVFHSSHFRLIELRRLPRVGSDHFPVLVELSYEPEARVAQPGAALKRDDVEEANEKLELQVEAARTGDDLPGRE